VGGEAGDITAGQWRPERLGLSDAGLHLAGIPEDDRLEASFRVADMLMPE
jgi:hypothetical protein